MNPDFPKQKFIHLEDFYIDDLCDKIKDKIELMNEDGYILKDFKLSHMEINEGNCHAYLLFELK